MMQTNEGHWWVRIYLRSDKEISELQKEYKIEVFTPSLRRIDKNNLLVEAYIPKRTYEKLKANYTVRILGEVEKMIKQASKYVSKINRYKKS